MILPDHNIPKFLETINLKRSKATTCNFLYRYFVTSCGFILTRFSMTKEKLFLFILSYSQKVKLRYVNFLGKTSLCQRFAHNYFTSKYTPTNGVQRSVIIAVIETDPKTRRQSLVFQNSFHKSVTPSFVERKKSTEVFLDEEDDGGSGPKKEPLEKKDSGARYRKVSQNS